MLIINMKFVTKQLMHITVSNKNRVGETKTGPRPGYGSYPEMRLGYGSYLKTVKQKFMRKTEKYDQKSQISEIWKILILETETRPLLI